MLKTSSIRSTVSIEHRLVTDRQTDRQTQAHSYRAVKTSLRFYLGHVFTFLDVHSIFQTLFSFKKRWQSSERQAD